MSAPTCRSIAIHVLTERQQLASSQARAKGYGKHTRALTCARASIRALSTPPHTSHTPASIILTILHEIFITRDHRKQSP